MKSPPLWFPLLLGLIALPLHNRAEMANLAHRSVSHTHQFYTYCSDTPLRLAVNSFVETTKSTVLSTLGIRDQWKLPIIINMMRPSTVAPQQALSDVRMYKTDDGAKVEITLSLKQNQFKEARFPQQIVRAVLLEFMHRDTPPDGGQQYFEAPAWLIEGISERLQTRTSGQEPNAALFKQLIETGRLPRVRDFLNNNVDAMDTTSRAVYSACCNSLIDMLTELPGGKKSLAALVKQYGKDGGDSVSLLLKHFPALGSSETSLEKWWTLGLARVSASDRYLALDIKQSNARLESVLSLSIATDKEQKEVQQFALSDYKKFIKLPGAKPALRSQQSALNELQPNVHPLLHPIVAEYQRLSAELENGKTRKIDEPLLAIASYRTMIVERMGKIEDYLNWFEATQMPEWSGTFDDYLRTAKAIENTVAPKRSDPISRYIDQIEQEFN